MWLPYLTGVRDRLAVLPGVKTCRIGLEVSLSAEDYPMIRLVPARMTRVASDRLKRQMELTVYYGAPLVESDESAEAQWDALFALEALIIDALSFGSGYLVLFIDTTPGFVTQEQTAHNLHFQVFASRFQITTHVP